MTASDPPDYQPVLGACPPVPKKFLWWKWMGSGHRYVQTGKWNCFPYRYGDAWYEVECLNCGQKDYFERPGGP